MSDKASSGFFGSRANRNAASRHRAEVLGPFFKTRARRNVSVLRQPGAPGFRCACRAKCTTLAAMRWKARASTCGRPIHAGRYDVVGYQYRTKLAVPAGAEYVVETIMPGHYDDRPAHAHSLPDFGAWAQDAGHAIYFATDPFFEGDVDKNYRKRNVAENRELVRPVTLYEAGTPRAAVNFDLVLERA